MYNIQFSPLETALLPYFLFVVYAAIVCWIRSVQNAEPSVAVPNDVSVIDYGELDAEDFTISVPVPAPGASLANEFELEVLSRVVLPMSDEEVQALPPIPKPTTRKHQPKSTAELIAQEWDKA